MTYGNLSLSALAVLDAGAAVTNPAQVRLLAQIVGGPIAKSSFLCVNVIKLRFAES